MKRRAMTADQPTCEDDEQLVANALLDLQNTPQFCDRGTDPEPDLLEAKLTALRDQYTELQDAHKGLQEEYQRLLTENHELKDNIKKITIHLHQFEQSANEEPHWLKILCSFCLGFIPYLNVYKAYWKNVLW